MEPWIPTSKLMATLKRVLRLTLLGNGIHQEVPRVIDRVRVLAANFLEQRLRLIGLPALQGIVRQQEPRKRRHLHAVAVVAVAEIADRMLQVLFFLVP